MDKLKEENVEVEEVTSKLESIVFDVESGAKSGQDAGASAGAEGLLVEETEGVVVTPNPFRVFPEEVKNWLEC